MPDEPKEYRIGVMKTIVDVEITGFHEIVDPAVKAMERFLTQREVGLRVDVLEFLGPHLLPAEGAYSPLDFMQLGIAEKLERKLHFLLIITEVDLSTTTQSYLLALPSQLTNIGIISTKRLSPRFWGKPEDPKLTTRRLEILMLHTIGHLLNLPHSDDRANVMHDVQSVDDLDLMNIVTDEQINLMKRNLPSEAREQVSQGNLWMFALRRFAANWATIVQAMLRANPLELALRLPTMITAGISVIVVLFFSAETWDLAGSVQLYQVALFSLIGITAATMVLYKAFGLRAVPDRSRMLAESTVVAAAATVLSLLATVVVLYLLFFALIYLSAATIFPTKLMTTWPTVDPAVHVIDHVRLGMFLAAMGVLTGSLGGAAARKELIRHILFVDEET